MLLISLASRSTSEVPICSVFAWLMNRWFGHVTSESNETTLIPADYGLRQRRAERRRVVARDDDGVSLCLDGCLDGRNLGGRSVGGATADDHLAAELGQCRLTTLVSDDLVRVLGVLRDEVDGQTLLDGRRCAARGARGGSGRRCRGSRGTRGSRCRRRRGRRGCGGTGGRQPPARMRRESPLTSSNCCTPWRPTPRPSWQARPRSFGFAR